MAGRVTGLFRGEGGSVIAMDLPLPESIAERVAKGLILRVDEDGNPWTEDAALASSGDEAAPKPKRPPRRAG